MYIEYNPGSLHEHSVFNPSMSKSTMKSLTYFSLLLAVTARQCCAEIIIKTKKLDKTSILESAVSTLLFNLDIFMYRFFFYPD